MEDGKFTLPYAQVSGRYKITQKLRMITSMNKQDFLNTVRLGINNKSHDSLKKLVLEFARLILRDNFEEALLSLKKSDVVIVRNTFVDLAVAVKQLCEGVGNGDYDLAWDYEEGYYDGCYSDDETLADRDGLGEEIQGLLETAIVYVKENRYSEAFAAFDELFFLSIPMGDYDDINISTMFSYDLINLQISEVLLYYAYTTVMTLRGDERIHKLYEIAGIANYNIKMQEIIHVGTDDIPERKEFEKQWIAFLLTRNLCHHEHILFDAILLSGGIESLHNFTIDYGTKYRTAYIRLAEMYIDEKEYPQAVFIILDGFSKLNGINNTRTKIADLLMNIGNTTEDQSLIDKAVWEGFSSSVDLRHFINICNLRDKNLKDMAIDFLYKHQGKSNDSNYIRFLYGDYESVYTACASDKKFLGWSMSEKGRMIPLFIALLANRDPLSPCTTKLIDSNFPHSNIKEAFFQVFIESYKRLSDTEWKNYFNWCLKEADGRVEAIVRGQHRGSYYKASALIVSLAEAMRSSGDEMGAKNFIVSYKEKYPRHSSFRACLKQDIGLAKFGKLF